MADKMPEGKQVPCVAGNGWKKAVDRLGTLVDKFFNTCAHQRYDEPVSKQSPPSERRLPCGKHLWQDRL